MLPTGAEAALLLAGSAIAGVLEPGPVIDVYLHANHADGENARMNTEQSGRPGVSTGEGILEGTLAAIRRNGVVLGLVARSFSR